MFIVSIEYTTDVSKVDALIPEHITFFDKYYEQGIFITSGRKVPRTGGIILARANSKETLADILKEDPFYQADIANYVVTEFVPSKFAEGFETMDTID